MENTYCCSCNEKFTNDYNCIAFTCNHHICYDCSPLLFLNILSMGGLNADLFLNQNNCFICPFCDKGKAIKELPIEKLHTFNQNKIEDPEKQKCMNECGDIALMWCNECCAWLCLPCGKSLHNNALMKKHNMIGLEKRKQQCFCNEKNPVEKYCINCRRCICSVCSASLSHKGHEQKISAKSQKNSKFSKGKARLSRTLWRLSKIFLVFKKNT